jgi:uncharacterized protein (TIGR02118 family)
LICLSSALTRLSHLSAADFLAHWRNVHAPLVASLAGDLGIRRYVQIHALGEETLTALGVTGAPLCDGVAQIWFDDQAAALSARDTAAGKAAFAQLRHDEANFIAREKSRLWWGEPHLVLG